MGAAGLATGVTRAISTAVIVYELCGQPHLRLPLSIVVLTAYFVGNRFSKNVYEVLIGNVIFTIFYQLHCIEYLIL